MARDPKVKIKVEADTRQAQQNLKGVNRELRSTDQASKLAGGGLAGLTSKYNLMAGGAFVAVGAVVGLGRAVLNMGQEFERAESTIARATGTTGKDLERHFSEAKKVMGELPDRFSEVAASYGAAATLMADSSKEAIGQMTRQVHDFARIAGGNATVITEQLGRAGTAWGLNAGEVAGAIDVMTGAAQKWGIEGGKLARQLQEFGPLFNNAGLSIEETTVLFGALSSAGINVSRIGPAINRFGRDVAAAGGDIRTELGAAIETIRTAASDTEALNFAAGVFGAEGAQRMVTAIRSGAVPALEELAEAAEKAKVNTGDLADETATSTERISEAWNNLKTELQPVFTFITDGIAGIMEAASGAVEFLSDPEGFIEGLSHPRGGYGTWGYDEQGELVFTPSDWKPPPALRRAGGKADREGTLDYGPDGRGFTPAEGVSDIALATAELRARNQGVTAFEGRAWRQLGGGLVNEAQRASVGRIGTGIVDEAARAAGTIGWTASTDEGVHLGTVADAWGAAAACAEAAAAHAEAVAADAELWVQTVEHFGQEAIDQAMELGVTREELQAKFQAQEEAARQTELDTILDVSETVTDFSGTLTETLNEVVSLEQMRKEVLEHLGEEELARLEEMGATVEQIWGKIEAHSRRMLDAAIDAALQLEDVSKNMKTGPGGGRVATPENGLMQEISPNDPLFWTAEQREKFMPLHKQIERDWKAQGGEIPDRWLTEGAYNKWKTFRDAHPAARGGPLAAWDPHGQNRYVWDRMTPEQQAAMRKQEERDRLIKQGVAQGHREQEGLVRELERKLDKATRALEKAAGKQMRAADKQLQAADPNACGPAEHHVYTAAGPVDRAQYRAMTRSVA